MTPDIVVTIFLRTIALFLGLAVSNSSSKTLRIVFLMLHPRSLCVSADFDGKINLRMSKSVFSGFSGVAEFLQKSEDGALLSTKSNPMARLSSALGPTRDRWLDGDPITPHCFKLARASLNFQKELLCPATKLESSREVDLDSEEAPLQNAAFKPLCEVFLVDTCLSDRESASSSTYPSQGPTEKRYPMPEKAYSSEGINSLDTLLQLLLQKHLRCFQSANLLHRVR